MEDKHAMTFQGISQVDFGHIAAEEEAGNLQRYFIETEEYKKVKSDAHKILVIGRKGSGKSAIYLALRDYLPTKEKAVVVEALSLQDYPWKIHKEVDSVK
jgi:ABC-type multidrug transport system fused ATPase/permease subunit